MDYSDRLSDATGANVYLKREDLLSVRSYKVRGAYNLLDATVGRGIGRRVGVLVGGQPRSGIRPGVPLDGRARPGLRAGQDPKQKRDRIRYHGGEFIELIVGGATYDLPPRAARADVAKHRRDAGPAL